MGCRGQKRASQKSPSATTTAQAPAFVSRQSPPSRPLIHSSSGPLMPAPNGLAARLAARVSVSAAVEGVVALRYLENTSISVLGPATGKRYSFSASDPLQRVDRRDVATLLRTHLFGRC